MSKPILLLDFDGVLHSYTSGWKGVDVISDPPVEGALDFVMDAVDHFEVCVYSSRSKTSEGRSAIFIWLEDHGFPMMLMNVTAEKPAAFLTIDDRCVCFDGTFPDASELLAFTPWNRKKGERPNKPMNRHDKAALRLKYIRRRLIDGYDVACAIKDITSVITDIEIGELE